MLHGSLNPPEPTTQLLIRPPRLKTSPKAERLPHHVRALWELDHVKNGGMAKPLASTLMSPVGLRLCRSDMSVVPSTTAVMCPPAMCPKPTHAHSKIVSLFDHLVGGSKQRWRNSQAECLCCFRLMTNSNFVGCTTGRSAGFSPLRIRPA